MDDKHHLDIGDKTFFFLMYIFHGKVMLSFIVSYAINELKQ